jgi:hypothetical protein
MADALAKINALRGKKKEMSPMEKEAKLGIMKDIQGMASKAMGSKLDGLKKVTVASDSKEGVSHGLEKAKDLIEGSADEESGESPEFEASEDESTELPGEEVFSSHNPPGHTASGDMPSEDYSKLSHDEIDEKIKELLRAKSQKS